MTGAVSGIGPARGAMALPRARAYQEAQRHSRRVRVLKAAIMALSTLAVVGVLASTFFDPFGRLAGVQVGPISLSGTRVAMENPRLTGFRKDSRGYEVTADNAYQDIRRPGIIELERMKARMALDESGRLAHLVARAGVYDSQKEQLELNHDIRVTTDDGQEALLASASVDFKTGSVVSNQPVRVTLNGAKVEAQGMRIVEGGKVISFTGRVHTLVEPSASGDKAGRAPQHSAEARP
jgi:lipopolysaccharide export system protein LptC